MKKSVVLFIIMLFIVSGCAYFDKGTAKEEPVQPKFEQLNQAYHGFPDVPVPKELRLINEKSFVYEAANMRAGVLVLRGNVDLQSLENYFKSNMIKNGWKFVNSFKSKEVALNFTKEDKTCHIKMIKESFDAEVEIWVGSSTSTVPSASTEKGTSQKGNVFK
ncbi:MAG: hypothetical protein NTX75_18040 [Proteobacteria bacterium]|nr:hypothetical protein [Pseudomonadota bacterium]